MARVRYVVKLAQVFVIHVKHLLLSGSNFSYFDSLSLTLQQ